MLYFWKHLSHLFIHTPTSSFPSNIENSSLAYFGMMVWKVWKYEQSSSLSLGSFIKQLLLNNKVYRICPEQNMASSTSDEIKVRKSPFSTWSHNRSIFIWNMGHESLMFNFIHTPVCTPLLVYIALVKMKLKPTNSNWKINILLFLIWNWKAN